jgi:AcrR family transcriptional regulator
MADADARTRLREAALELFGRHGIAATSTRAILSAAGLRNPSAINYHFGSKTGLVDDLVGELIRGTQPVLQRQVGLVSERRPPTAEEWVGIPVDSALALTATERGCLLARLWWEYDNTVHPHAIETFLGSGTPLAFAWLEAVRVAFPALPHLVAVARNVVMFRTLELMVARRASRLLDPDPGPIVRVDDPLAARQLILEIAVGIVSMPTELGPDDLTLS